MNVNEQNNKNFFGDVTGQPNKLDSDVAKKYDELDLKSYEDELAWWKEWLERDSKYWHDIKETYFNTFTSVNKKAFETNRYINIALVCIGIVLIANSIIYSWVKGVDDLWSFISGGIGIGSFVTLFFMKTQYMVFKAVGNLAQIQMIYQSHSTELELLKFYSTDMLSIAHDKEGMRPSLVKELLELYNEHERSTEKYVKLIERYTENVKDDNGDKQSGQESNTTNNAKKTPI